MAGDDDEKLPMLPDTTGTKNRCARPVADLPVPLP